MNATTQSSNREVSESARSGPVFLLLGVLLGIALFAVAPWSQPSTAATGADAALSGTTTTTGTTIPAETVVVVAPVTPAQLTTPVVR